MALGASLLSTKGKASPEAERAYARARDLCQEVEDTPQVFAVLVGLSRSYGGRGELQSMLEVGEQLLTLAQRQQNAAGLMAAHWTLGVYTFVRGALPSAHAHLEHVCALANAQNFNVSALLQGYDAQVLGLCWGCLAYWLLGYPVQALQWGQEVLRRGRDTTDLHRRVYGLIYAARLHQNRREARAAYALAEKAVALCTEQGLAHWLAPGRMIQGWALAARGQAQEGLAQLQQGLDDDRATGAKIHRPYYLALLAEVYGNLGQTADGLTILAEALAVVEATGEWVHEAALYQLKGEFLRKQAVPDVSQAETCFHHALSIACRRSPRR